MIEGLILAATLASAPCEPTTLIIAPGYSIVIGGNCPVAPELRAIIDDIKARRTTITKTGDELPLPIAPPPELTKAKAETVAAKPAPKKKAKAKAKAKPKRSKKAVKTRCGSKRAVWYTNSKGQRRYRCR
jgi:hypothetical protein